MKPSHLIPLALLALPGASLAQRPPPPPAGPSLSVPEPPALVEISSDFKVFWSTSRQDYFNTATFAGAGAAGEAGYTNLNSQGWVWSKPDAGRAPLELWWSAARGDNFTCATAAGKGAAKDAGYVFVRIEGYVATEKAPGMLALDLYWHAGRGDNVLSSDPVFAKALKGLGYVFVRTEGYAKATQL